jgi:hypothetical protein
MEPAYTTDYKTIRHKLSNDGEIALLASATVCPRLGYDKLAISTILVLENDIWIGELNLFLMQELYVPNNGFIIYGTPKFRGQGSTNEMYDAKQIKKLTSLEEYLNSLEDTLFQVDNALGTAIIRDLLKKNYRCMTTPSVIGDDISEYPNMEVLIVNELQQLDPFGRLVSETKEDVNQVQES